MAKKKLINSKFYLKNKAIACDPKDMMLLFSC